MRIHTVWKTVLRLVLSAVAIFLVFHEINFKEFFGYLVNINRNYYFLAIGLQIISALVAAYKWDMIMVRMGYDRDFPFYAKAYLVGTMFNQILPTSVGGDAVRIGYAHKLGAGFRKVLADRYYGVVGLVLLNIAVLFSLRAVIPSALFTVICLVLLAVSGGLVFALLLSRFHFLKNIKIIQMFYELSQALVNSIGSLPHIFMLLLLAVLANFLTIFSIYLISLSLNLPITLLEMLGVIPIITLITLLPISFAGWGVREGAMVGFLLFLHLPKTAILSLSVLYGIMLILASLPGLYFYVFHKVEPKVKHEEPLS
jgi:glycosyltransferase 2 family protein